MRREELEIKKIVVGPLQTNCYLVARDDKAIVIDPGDEAAKIASVLHAAGLSPVAIVLTHGHWDHFGAAEQLKREFGIRIFVHELDSEFVKEPHKCTFRHFEWLKNFSAFPDEFLTEGEFTVGPFSFSVIHTPGHSKGSCCFFFPDEKVIFTGDTLFKNGIGRTDLACSIPEMLPISLKRLAQLPDEVAVYPGHGLSTTIGDEKEFNLYFEY